MRSPLPLTPPAEDQRAAVRCETDLLGVTQTTEATRQERCPKMEVTYGYEYITYITYVYFHTS